jgi:ABC-type uncharacterized transport system auxiliary subunit
MCLLLATLLTGCMTLPGSDTPIASRFNLQGPQERCDAGGEALVLTVPTVNVGLGSDRIARRDIATGELSFLKDVRWAAEVDRLMEQRLARDLECNGFTVLSSHHHGLGQAQLVCEVRALNLVRDGDRNAAEVGLSCLYYPAGGGAERPFVSLQRESIDRWTAASAVAGISRAYQAVLGELLTELR